MNFKKPIVRIKLERQIKITQSGIIYGEGPDHWVVYTFQSTTEGQKNENSFRSMHKELALEKAYKYLELTQKFNTFNYKDAVFRQEEMWRREQEAKPTEPKEEQPYIEIPVSPNPNKHKCWALFKAKEMSYSEYKYLESQGFPDNLMPQPKKKGFFASLFS